MKRIKINLQEHGLAKWSDLGQVKFKVYDEGGHSINHCHCIGSAGGERFED